MTKYHDKYEPTQVFKVTLYDNLPQKLVITDDYSSDWDLKEKKFIRCPKCDAEYVFYHQQDEDPEYDTHITMRCTCGNQYISITFPVN